MSISVSDVLTGRAYHDAVAQLKNYEAQLAAHLAQDYESIKAKLEAHLAHFRAEEARLKALLHPSVLAHVLEGKSPNDAVTLAEASVPTNAEAAAKAAAETAAAAAAPQGAESGDPHPTQP
jgi:hypothetical protein